MSTYLHLFGRPSVDHAGKSLALPAERRNQLLVLLALRRTWVSRAELAALFWPELSQERAYTNLRKSLHLARAVPWAAEALELQGSALRLNVATDMHDFERAMHEGRLADAVQLRRGELLDGLDDDANAAWSDWLGIERANFARRWLELTRARLAQLENAPRERAAFARELLAADPLDEDAVVALLTAQRELGLDGEQRATYRNFATWLAEELGIDPSARVRELVRAPAQAVVPAVAPAVPSDGFIGRARELEELSALLMRPECRLLTVTGPGGVGKSSVVKQALRQLAVRFADGVHWIALDELADSAHVVARIAVESKLALTATQDPLQALCTHLKQRRALLVLDNGEHLVGLGRLVERLLADTAELKVCATSRARLDARGEWLLPLDGLALPPARSGSAEVLATDAAQLFVAAADAMKPDFNALTHAAAIGELVRAVGGLPLAILLAANWIRVLPVAEIAAELERSLDVLESTDEGEERPEHRSVRATFANSWQMLAPREQQALAALSVFVGGFSRVAAREVADAALPLLAALADKSLLQMLAGGRCSLHPLIRQFAHEKLDAQMLAEARRRHASWFVQMLARLEQPAEAGDQSALDEIGSDLENCRQAWRWAIANGRTEQIATSVTALKQFFNVRGRSAEGLELLCEAQSAVFSGPTSTPGSAGTLAAAIAQTQYRLTRLDDAAAAAQKGIRFARAAGNRGALIRCLNVLGTCYWQWGRNLEAKRLLEQSLRQARAAKDVRGESMAMGNLGLIEKALGNYERAGQLMLDWLSQQRELGEWLRVALGLNNLAYLHQARGEWKAAQVFLREGLEICKTHGFASTRPALLANLALVYFNTGELDEAERACSQVLDEARLTASRAIEATALNQMVRIAVRRGDFSGARVHLQEAINCATATRNAEIQLESVFGFAKILAGERDTRAAASLLNYFLARSDLEPADRAEAQSILNSLLADSDAELAPGISLEALVQRIAGEIKAPQSRQPA